MNKKMRSIDGLVPRSDGSELAERRTLTRQQITPPPRKELRSASDLESETIGRYRPQRSIARAEIDESLRGLDDEPAEKISRHQRKLLRKNPAIAKKKRRIWKRIAIALLVIIIALGGYVAYRALSAAGSVFTGSIFGVFHNDPLKMDANGRSNFLILGSTDDDPDHPGNNLTDTIMVVSVNQKTKDVVMFSVPRDLYVNYGMACPAGYQGKINSYFSCSNSGTSKQDEQDRLAKTEKFIGNIFGIDFQYGIHVNSVVVRDAVNAVGGIDVDIEGSGGAPGILDRNFDASCNYTCYRVKYTNGVHHLNGGQAMYLAMARGDVAPTYGLGRSNFDREQNQQKIIKGLLAKATSTGFLTNPSAVTKLIDAVGNNLRTNIDTKEIQTIMDIAHDVKSSDIHSIDFLAETPPLFTTGNMGSAGSVVYPTAGVDDYTDLQVFIEQQLSANPLVREGAKISVLNGTSVAGLAEAQASTLKQKGFDVIGFDNADDDNYKTTKIYQLHDNLPNTKQKLTDIYGIVPVKATPPFTVNANADFVIVLGQDVASSDNPDVVQ